MIQPTFTGNHLSGITLSPTSVMFLAARMAADVIQACEHNPPDSRRYLDDPVSQVFRDVRWAEHGFTNTLGQYVQVLGALVEARIHEHALSGYSMVLADDTAAYVVKALTVFGDWKARMIQRDKERHGERWGSALGWNQWDVTEKLEAFYATFHPDDLPLVKRLL